MPNDSSNPDGPIPVLFFAGFGRSGTTIIGDILAATGVGTHVGEFMFLFGPGLREHRPCACGFPLTECEFWGDVLGRYPGGFTDADIDEMLALHNLHLRLRSSPDLLRSGRREAIESSFSPYLERVRTLFRLVQEVSGRRLIIDTSKLPMYGYLLSRSKHFDVRVVQLLRDPRASAYSWHRGFDMNFIPSALGGETKEGAGRWLKKTSILHSARVWLVFNHLVSRLWRDHPERVLRVRFEDFVDDPQAVIRRILEHAGENPDLAAIPFPNPDTARLPQGHSVAGNPSRFRSGDVVIRSDGRWRSEMSLWGRSLVTLIDFPLLGRYGYPVRVPRRDEISSAAEEL